MVIRYLSTAVSDSQQVVSLVDIDQLEGGTLADPPLVRPRGDLTSFLPVVILRIA